MFGITRYRHVPYGVGRTGAVDDTGQRNRGTFDVEVQQLGVSGALHTEAERGAGFTAQTVADRVVVVCHFAQLGGAHLLAVDSHDHIAASQPSLRRRHASIGLRNDTALFLLVKGNHGTYAGILARRMLSELLGLLRRIITGIGVQLIQHVADGFLEQFARVECVYEIKFQFAVDFRQGVELFSRLQIALGGLSISAQYRQTQDDGRQVSFHIDDSNVLR